jgi:dihydropyrimidinase
MGISSVKIYMTYEALRLNDEQFLDVLFQARLHRVTTLVHAENDSVIAWMTKKLHERQLYAPKYHTDSHPAIAEIEASYRAICLAEFIDTPILIVHVSNPRAVDNIRRAQAKGLPIYAETCPQYLFLSSENLDRPGLEGAKCVCSPPLRNKSDHEAIWAGLEDGTFTILSSDHSPFNFNDSTSGKGSSVTAERPDGQFHLIPNGFSGVETRMPLVLSADRLKIQRYVELTSTNPAKLYGMYPRKGALMPGVSDADFVIWYPDGSLDIAITNDILHHDVDYTPFEGHKVKQWPRYTVLRGQVVWDREDGGVVGARGFGQFLHRTESMLAGSRSDGSWDVETAWV